MSLEPVTRKLRAGQPVRFATFGDSITWPCFHTDFRQNYITVVADALRQAYPAATLAITHDGTAPLHGACDGSRGARESAGCGRLRPLEAAAGQPGAAHRAAERLDPSQPRRPPAARPGHPASLLAGGRALRLGRYPYATRAR